jgi:hypothetical protein
MKYALNNKKNKHQFHSITVQSSSKNIKIIESINLKPELLLYINN